MRYLVVRVERAGCNNKALNTQNLEDWGIYPYVGPQLDRSEGGTQVVDLNDSLPDEDCE